MAAKDLVEKMIAENKVMVFSKSYCPYCKMAKSALEAAGLKNYKVLELENRDDCAAIQDYLSSKTGSRTVPQVFINGKFVGGGTECKQLQQSGQLKKLLQEAGAL